MALALLTLEQQDGGGLNFRGDLGSNRYYRYVVGKPTADDDDGFPVLRETSHQSEMFGPVPESSLGWIRFSVPSDLVNRNYNTIQLWTYRTSDMQGPVVSRPIRVRSLLTPVAGSANGATLSLTRLGSGSGDDPVPMSARYRSLEYSEAQFLPALAALLPTLIPIVAKALPTILPMVAGLFGGGSPAAPAPAPAGTGLESIAGLLSRLAADPNAAPLLQQLLTQISAAQSDFTLPATAKDITRALDSSGESSRSPATAPSIAEVVTEFTPALLVMLRQVASPEAVNAVISTLPPPRALALILEGLHQWSAFVNRTPNAANNGGSAVAAKSLSCVPQSVVRHLSSDFVATAGRLPYRRVTAVRLVAENTPLPVLSARPQFLLSFDRPVRFSLRVETPKSIPDAELLIEGKHPVTLAKLFEKRISLGRVTAGPLEAAIVLQPIDLESVPLSEEFILSFTLLWKGREGKRLGTSLTQLCRRAGAYLFDRIGAGWEIVGLSEVERHRGFWHKVWQQSLDRSARRYNLAVKYTYALNQNLHENTRAATTWSATPRTSVGLEGCVESGLETASTALNALLPLGGADAPWPPERLAALASSDFAEKFHRQARRSVEFSGRPGETVTLWVYPEVQLHEIVLQRPTDVDADGFVRALTPETYSFPLPVAAHFIGAKTES